ncbi:MAG: hypothetical protein JNK04_26105 [Myxococcales bacterium]|nr:hypothetical protein [Myxococcales bacterium]
MVLVSACSSELRPVHDVVLGSAATPPTAFAASALPIAAHSSAALAPTPSSPAPAIEPAPPCTATALAGAAGSGIAKLKSRRRVVAVFAIERERGACRVRYADGDNEDSLAAVPEICDANRCLPVGQLFAAQLRVLEADLPCNGASFCVDSTPTYRGELVVELTPR